MFIRETPVYYLLSIKLATHLPHSLAQPMSRALWCVAQVRVFCAEHTRPGELNVRGQHGIRDNRQRGSAGCWERKRLLHIKTCLPTIKLTYFFHMRSLQILAYTSSVLGKGRTNPFTAETPTVLLSKRHNGNTVAINVHLPYLNKAPAACFSRYSRQAVKTMICQKGSTLQCAT